MTWPLDCKVPVRVIVKLLAAVGMPFEVAVITPVLASVRVYATPETYVEV